MRILVAIANYGDENRSYVERLIREYQDMPWNVDIVILSEKQKVFDSDVEVRVGLPSPDPWSLPFAHKRLFAERSRVYDLYIYSEDDTLITESHVTAFLNATRTIPAPRIVGFLRYEEGSDGKKYCSTAHSHFHWRPGSVEHFGDHTVAEFSNAHSAAFMLTRNQLNRAIASGGFVVPPHNEFYDLPCTAATDPYTQCGMRKVICVSHMDSFLLHHMPNKYVGRLGMPLEEFVLQIPALTALSAACVGELFPIEKSHVPASYSKSYYESAEPKLVEAIPSETRVFSVGAGTGALERALIEKGCDVSALSLDPVISSLAERSGVPMVERTSSDLHALVKSATRRLRPDRVVLANVLQHVEDPAGFIRAVSTELPPQAEIVGTVPNFGRVRRAQMRRRIETLGYRQSKLQAVTPTSLRSWCKAAGLKTRLGAIPDPRRSRTLKRFCDIYPKLLGDVLLFRLTRSS